MKNFILTAALATSALSSTITFSIPSPFSAQTGKILCKYIALPFTTNIAVCSLLGSNLIKTTPTVLKKHNLIACGIGFLFLTPITIAMRIKEKKLPSPCIGMTLTGAVGMVTSYAAMKYFDNRIKANADKKALEQKN